MRIIFMGTPPFALPALEALHKSTHTIAAVYTQPPRPAGRGQKDTPSLVGVYAVEHNLPVHTPASLKDTAAQAEFAAYNVDIAVVTAYGLLLPKAILQAPRFGCINIHPSLLPRWRGAAPIQRTLMAGDKETAVCIMQMDEGLDTGPILLQQRFPIPESINAGALHDALAALGAQMTLQVLEAIPRGGISATAQSLEGVTYAPKIGKQECHINWQRSATGIRNMIRALSPSPGAFFMHNNEAIKILEARVVENTASAPPGQVFNEQLTIACGCDALQPVFMQRPGKKAMLVEECLRGFVINPGNRLA